ncbi:MAG: glycosyltransferase family 2 protein [Candidatus Hydrogenedentes bacterium]|nr:glycosyltransferase family 2 protein [Candidatus Hydrogenedentota bacterium]
MRPRQARFQTGWGQCYTRRVMNTPSVYVLVINWNGLEHLEACYDSLLASTYAHCRFWLLDNGSTDESVAFVQSRYGHDSRVEIVSCGGNLGWSGGNNVGMRRALDAGADYIFLLNNDTAIAPDAIACLVCAAESDSTVGALAPKMVLFSEPQILNSVGITCSIIGGSWDMGIGRLDGEAWNSPQEVAAVCGGAMFIRSAALRQAGLLPERFEIYLDDVDLGLRIWDCGYRIVSTPGAVVHHKFSATYGSGARARYKYYLNTRNRFWLVLRNFPMGLLVMAAPYLVLGELKAVGRSVIDGEYWRVLAHAKAWLATVLQLRPLLRGRNLPGVAGNARGQYRKLLRRHPLFCPPVELPQSGWYGEVTVRGQRVRPISSLATLVPETRSLNILHVNAHPALGATQVRVVQDGATIAELSTTDEGHVVLEVRGTPVTFYAEKIFPAEATGARADYGGWLAVQFGNAGESSV